MQINIFDKNTLNMVSYSKLIVWHAQTAQSQNDLGIFVLNIYIYRERLLEILTSADLHSASQSSSVFSSKVSVTAREDVPLFGPVLPDPPVFSEVGQKNQFKSPEDLQECTWTKQTNHDLSQSITEVLCFLCFSVPCWENSFWPNSSMQRFPATRLSSSADWRWTQNCVDIICQWILKLTQFYLCPLLKLRTRSSLLESLQAELSTQSQCMMGDPSLSALPSSEGVRGASEGSGGFIENFKVRIGFPPNILWLYCLYSDNCLVNRPLQRAIRVRSHSFETLGVPRKISGSTSQRPKVKTPNGSEEVSLNIYLLRGVIILYNFLHRQRKMETGKI